MRKPGQIILVVVVVLLAALTAGPFLIPIPPLEGTRPAGELADPDSQFIEINGLSVHVKTMGQAEPVIVLLHGFGASLYSWQAVMEPLSQQATVIAYDRPGFGLTERPIAWTGENPYSLDTQAALLIGLLDHFGAGRAVLVGNSAGGAVAMKTALDYPGRVMALVFVDPSIYTSGGPGAWLRPLLATPQVRRLGPLFARQLKSRGMDLLGMAWHNPELLTPETIDLYQKPLQVNDWDKALWEFTLAQGETDLAGRLGEVSLPVLVITGDDDRIVPTADSIRLAGELPGARLIVIPEAGHVPHEEQPAAFLEAVESFLSTLAQ